MMTDLTQNIMLTNEIQGRAIDPRHSAWISANAGSGKTYILTRRVIRLLIDQAVQNNGHALPERILCITFTKAAAAEMEQRLYEELGKLSLCSEEALRSAVKELGVELEDEHVLLRVRTLFAQALETPGGLKIQTIHSFCERMLRRFPREAGLLPGFEVSEEDEKTHLSTQFKELLQEEGLPESLLQAAQSVLQEWQDPETRLYHIAAAHRTIRQLRMQSRDTTLEGMLMELREGMGLPEHGVPADWKRDAIKPTDLPLLELLRDRSGSFKKRMGERSAESARALSLFGDDPLSAYTHLTDIWLTASGGISYLKEVNDALDRELPGHAFDILAFLTRLSKVECDCRAYSAYERATHILTLTWALADRYADYKEKRGILDFDDLILLSLSLLREVDQAWVQYKLDNGIDHILLDEAQDTSQTQWRVLEVFRDEIVSQSAYISRLRTVFVVGDKKQSIYSFQGADADLFAVKRSEMDRKMAPVHSFAQEQLFLSFRSSPAILSFVDNLFPEAAAAGISDGQEEELMHRAYKEGLPGLVEVWPIISRPEKEPIKAWDLPVDSRGQTDPARRLADQICIKIKELLDPNGRGRLGKERPAQPGDILILCQRRTHQFYEIIKALARHEIPSGGADRIHLKEDIAVQDIISHLRFSTNHQDDLSLAEALKSPLWGFTDDDLFELTRDRGGLSLWVRMERVAKLGTPLAVRCAKAVEQIRAAENLGAQSSPFAFISALLETGNPSGWSRFRARLGYQSDEPLEELLNVALDFGNKEHRSMAAFLSHLEGLDIQVKKEQSDATDVVRVMSVHGAKGLEAPIVFLADANHRPSRQSDKSLEMPLASGINIQIARPRSSQGMNEVATEALKAAVDRQERKQYQEYRRKLYVAATRAEEELYICGTEHGKRNNNDPDNLHELVCEPPLEIRSWQGLAVTAMQALGDGVTQIPAAWDDDTPIFRYQVGQAEETQHTEENSYPVHPAPTWLLKEAPSAPARLIEFPSASADGDKLALPVTSPLGGGKDGSLGRQRGTFIHLLLEKLPDVALADRNTVAARLARQRLSHLPEETQHDWIKEAMDVLQDRQFADVFSPMSRAEVSIRGEVDGRQYSGQIDRLYVDDSVIRVVDYKTHRPPPLEEKELSYDIVRQMQIYARLLSSIYPSRDVEAAILWTHGPRLMAISPDKLR